MLINETAVRQWADRQECRSKLPVLVRRLIRETTPALSSLRFPGNEAIDLAGFDGLAENDAKTVWVPKGQSVWEMGCSQNPRTKADGDFSKRTDETSKEVRERSSFVFVTPRRWNRKGEWTGERRREGAWVDVCAYDAIDLETWLAEAPETSRWLGELLGIAVPGLMTPHEWWQRWSTASAPPISKKLVATRRHNENDQLLSKLQGRQPVVSVQADDRKEAVAFVVAAMIEADALELLGRTLVATSGNVGIPVSPSHSIVIADVEEGEDPDFGDRRNKTIVRPYPKGRFDVHDAIQLSHVPSELFRSELEAMGISRDEAASRALKSGHSVPVLRRQLSNDPEIKRPAWARNKDTAKRLLPFALAGSWVERENIDDNIVLQLLGEFDEESLEQIRNELLTLNDAPIARYGDVNVVVSQLDALFALGPFIQREELERFFELAEMLLGDRDPALDLPQDQWWKASLQGKGRNYSRNLLSGVGDALCILSVHGAVICGNRLGIDISCRIDQVARSLMCNADESRWLTIRRQLRTLAEISPRVFLDCLEKDLKRSKPAICALMGATGGPAGGECLRSNLLWGLETLARYPEHFSRVAQIVFELRRIEVKDNWGNSPKSAARSLFHAWCPATSLSVAERMEVLRNLSKHYRKPTMDVCISLIPVSGEDYASPTARPRWRALNADAPEVTYDDIWDAEIEANRILLDLSPFDKQELETLIAVACRLYPDTLNRLIKEIELWAAKADDNSKADLRHKLRLQATNRSYHQNNKAEELDAAFRQMETVLDPVTIEARHRWLFESAQIEWQVPVGEDNEERWSFEDGLARAEKLRREAIEEIREQSGEDAIIPFAHSVQQPELVAQALIRVKAPTKTTVKWASAALRDAPSKASNAFLRQVLWTAGLNDLNAVCRVLSDQGLLDDLESRRRFAEHLPGCAAGWTVAEALGEDAQSAYWNSAQFHVRDNTTQAEIEYAVNKLIEYGRPRSAFYSIWYRANRLSPELWIRILSEMVDCGKPEIRLPKDYELEKVFKYLDSVNGITDEQIAKLELPFVSLLCPYGYCKSERTLAIHRELARDPALFVQLISWQFGRNDGQNETEQEAMTIECRKTYATLAFHVLRGWNTVPGYQSDGGIDNKQFTSWATNALCRAEEVDRKEVAEFQFGALLARFARGRSWDDWLPECVLEFLDQCENEGLRKAFAIGVHNARGVTTRKPYDGGEKERILAGRYRGLEAQMASSYPRVSYVLSSLADSYGNDAQRHDERAVVDERWMLN